MYKFQCQKCFITSGIMSQNKSDAPICCGGESMEALRIISHGGKRKNAGRKPAPYPTQLLKIQATKEELERILKLSTRERARALLEFES